MTRERTMELAAHIGRVIATAPVVQYTKKDVAAFKRRLTKEEIMDMRRRGVLGDDFEQYYVIYKFLLLSGVVDMAEPEYVDELLRAARHLDHEEFENNEYVKNIHTPCAQYGDILLTSMSYERGEILLYDMPDLSADTVVPKIGFFSKRVTFPTLYENEIPWISACPSEINSMSADIEKAHGRVLVLGLGIGYYLYMIAKKPEVKSITVVELKRETIDLFDRYLRPQFPFADKIKIVRADAIEYMKEVRSADFDFCYADIWEGAIDGAPLYEAIKAHEARLPDTEFAYWIEAQILSYLSDE